MVIRKRAARMFLDGGPSKLTKGEMCGWPRTKEPRLTRR